MPSSPLKPHQSTLIIAVLVAAVASVVPFVALLLLPLQYLNTHFHELSHAVMGSFTGGLVQDIEVHSDGSGITPISGGNLILSASAGYVGSAIIGSLVVFGGKREKSAKLTLQAMAVVLAISMLVWVRADLIGILSGIFWVITLFFLGMKLKGNGAIFACQFLGIELCLASFQSFLVLLHISAFPKEHSDASIVADATGISAMLWASAWSLLSLILVFFTIRSAWRADRPVIKKFLPR